MTMKKCINPDCGQEIDEKEESCPKCSVVFADLEEEVNVVTRAQKIVASRQTPTIPPQPQTPTAKAKKSLFASLARKKK